MLPSWCWFIGLGIWLGFVHWFGLLFCKKLLRVGKHYCFRKGKVWYNDNTMYTLTFYFRSKSVNLKCHSKVGRLRLRLIFLMCIIICYLFCYRGWTCELSTYWILTCSVGLLLSIVGKVSLTNRVKSFPVELRSAQSLSASSKVQFRNDQFQQWEVLGANQWCCWLVDR